MKLRCALAVALALVGGQALACYTVYGNGDRVLYQGVTPPVDMSQPLHQTLPAAYPGGHLVFATGEACPETRMTARAGVAPATGASPLLTDRTTASAMGVRHTVLASGVALVPQRPDDMRPGIVLAESGLPPALTEPDTSRMGAGPARAAHGNTVITEMHNPPMTVVQPGANSRR